MSDGLVFDIDGDPKGALAAYNKVVKENEKLIASQAKLVEASKRAAEAGSKQGDAFARSAKQGEAMAAGFVRSMSGAAAIAGVLTQAVRVLKSEYDAVIERQQKASRTVISTANSEMAMLRNVSPQDHGYWRSQVGGMAQRTGQTVSAVQQAIADASSAQGNQSNDQLRRNVELAMMVSPENPAEAQTIAGGLGDATRLTGSMDERVNMGAILAMGKQARFRSTPKIAENLIPGAVSVKGYGGTANEAMALNTTLSTLMNDQQGDKTQGSATRIASELDRIYGEKGSPLEHITALQNNPELLKKWYKGAGAGKPKADIPTHAEIAFKELVTKGSEADKLLRSNLSGFGTDAEMAGLTGDWLKSAYGSDIQQLAQTDRGFAAATNAAELADVPGARNASMRSRMNEVLLATGASSTDRGKYAMRFDVGTGMGADPRVAALDSLIQHRRKLQDPQLPEETRTANQASVAILSELMKELVREMKGMRVDQKGKVTKNIDQHTE